MPSSPSGYVGTQDDVILNRIGGFVLDYVLSIVAAVIVGVLSALALGSEAGITVGVVLGYAGYFIVPEGLYGQTIGKRAAGIVVVSRDGDPITFKQSVVRNVLRIVDGLFSYALGLAVMLLNDDRQRVGDIAAGTIVVQAH